LCIRVDEGDSKYVDLSSDDIISKTFSIAILGQFQSDLYSR
jgi:hypothetical protein